MSIAPATAGDLGRALAAVAEIAPVLTEVAVAADRSATFPHPSLAALRERRLLAAAAPVEFGGEGLGAESLCAIAHRLGAHCGSTAMIWAMHQIQLWCLLDSAAIAPPVADYLARAAGEQQLIASVTSEEGIGGDLRRSRAAIVPASGGFTLAKRAPTVSYAEAADAFLITARRSETSAAGDQVLVLALREQLQLTPTGTWDTLGMRATCSGPHEIAATVPAWQVLPVPFGELAARRMLPVSHVLWSAVWCGIAEDALRRAVGFVRRRLQGGTGDPNPRLGLMFARLRTTTDSVLRLAADYDAHPDAPGLGLRANALKLQVSRDASGIAELALEVCGMAGYSERGEFSVGRHLRDLASARTMISNDRLNAVISEMVAFGDAL